MYFHYIINFRQNFLIIPKIASLDPVAGEDEGQDQRPEFFCGGVEMAGNGDRVTDILGLIRKNREARGWTEYQLAERSGLPQSTISSWYKKGMTPSFSSLEKICEAFGLTLSQFFADAEDRLALTPAQRALLDKWSRLTPGQQSSLLALMDAMLEK